MEFESRHCSLCGKTKPIDQFRLFASGRHRYCDPCRLEANRKWRQANPNRVRENLWRWKAANVDRVREHAQRWRAANQERVQMMDIAGQRVHYAIKTGRLVRPVTCEECGATGCQITAAHRNYARPLDVRWLCFPCHIAWDRQEPKTLKVEEYGV